MATPAIVNTDSAVAPGAQTTVTLSIDAGTAPNRIITALATQALAQVNIDSATFDGVSLIADAQYTTGALRNVRFFHLKNPSSGVHDLVVTFASGTSRGMVIGAVYSNVDQAAPISGITNTDFIATGTTSEWTIASAVGDLVVALLKLNPTITSTWSIPAEERLDESLATSQATVADEVGATSVTIDVSHSGPSARSGTAFSLKAATELPDLIMAPRLAS